MTDCWFFRRYLNDLKGELGKRLRLESLGSGVLRADEERGLMELSFEGLVRCFVVEGYFLEGNDGIGHGEHFALVCV